jgi:hypothetical protein
VNGKKDLLAVRPRYSQRFPIFDREDRRAKGARVIYDEGVFRAGLLVVSVVLAGCPAGRPTDHTSTEAEIPLESRELSLEPLFRLWRDGKLGGLERVARDPERSALDRSMAAVFLFHEDAKYRRLFLDTYPRDAENGRFYLYDDDFEQICGEGGFPCQTHAVTEQLILLAESGDREALGLLIDIYFETSDGHLGEWVFEMYDGPVHRLRGTQPKMLFEEAGKRSPGTGQSLLRTFWFCGEPSREDLAEAARYAELALSGEAGRLRDEAVVILQSEHREDDVCDWP